MASGTDIRKKNMSYTKVNEDGSVTQEGSFEGPDGIRLDYLYHRSKDSEGQLSIFTREGAEIEPFFLNSFLDEFRVSYRIDKPETGWKNAQEMNVSEKEKLRSIAETLAMLDGNAFFGANTDEEGDDVHYEGYLPEAHALYESNGGDQGWSSEASFAKRQKRIKDELKAKIIDTLISNKSNLSSMNEEDLKQLMENL